MNKVSQYQWFHEITEFFFRWFPEIPYNFSKFVNYLTETASTELTEMFRDFM